ncbi:MAG: glycosyltransferase family 1 protein [Actinomycetia bacterium]|nr:glycosyltransferase family 1 protein [Actinomycetes bacterium]
MGEQTTIVAFPARKISEWESCGAWGRDAHLLQAMAQALGPQDTRVVVVDRARRWGSEVPRRTFVGSIVVETVPHPVEFPQWTRRGLPALAARRAAGRIPKQLQLDGGNGLVVCWDLMRWPAAARLAEDLGWALLTDVFDDWRLHPSMPAWRRHFEKNVYPALEGTDRIVSAVSRSAVEGAQAPLLVPNAGFHDGSMRNGPQPGPGRPTAAYVGTIHSRLDVEILTALRAGLGGWDVVVAGPAMDKRVRRYVAEANVRIVGWWAMRDIDRLATVVVCPYVRTSYTRTMDPLKVYEALARGVPCVSTLPIQRMPSRGLFVVDPADFVEAVNSAAVEPRPLVAVSGQALGSWGDRADILLRATGLIPRIDGVPSSDPPPMTLLGSR